MQHRRVGEIEHAAVSAARREDRGVYDNVGLKCANGLAQEFFARAFLQAGDKHGLHRESARGERIRQREDWRDVIREKNGAIKHQQRALGVGAGRPSRREAIAGAFDARAFTPGRRFADDVAREAEKSAHVLRAAILEERPDSRAILRRQRRGLAQTRIVQIFARNHSEREAMGA